MPERYSPEIVELIWTCLCDGMGPTEIRHRLREDEAGLGRAVDMPERTMAYYKNKLERERGKPRPYMKPGEEPTVTGAILRAAIALQAQELSRLEDKAAANGLNASEHKALDTLIRSTQEQQRRAANPESAKTRKGKQMKAGASTSPPSVLAALAREIKQREAEQKDPTPNGNGDGSKTTKAPSTKPGTKRSSKAAETASQSHQRARTK